MPAWKGNPSVQYWVVRLAGEKTPIGIITFIKRDYLKYYDIGFAFLSKFAKKGYAYEATAAILQDVVNNPAHTHILATTVKGNINSIKLLEKLGLRFQKEMEYGNNLLLIYSVTADKFFLHALTNTFFSVFKNAKQHTSDLQKIYNVCLHGALFVRKSREVEQTFNIATFIEPRKKILSDGTLTEFEEFEIAEETNVVANLAQRFSKYQKTAYLNGNYFKINGKKIFQYIKTNTGWRIASLIWEDEPV